MEVDVSDYATEGVLSIDYEDGQWSLVNFLSKFLNEIERNYEFHNKKMSTVIRGLENWKYLLEGIKFKFEIQIDHKNLEYFIKIQKLNRRQARQVLYLSKFNFTLKHVPGIKIEKTDRLSRQSDWKVDIENNNDNQVFIKDCQLHNLSEVVIEGSEVDILEKIKIARNKDKKVVRVVEEIKKAGVKVLREKEWQIERDLMLKEDKVYVLKNKALRVEIIQLHYNIPVIRHRRK